ncbi:MAG TPA: hypothetical protein VD903_02195 [Pseudonocardia sp.]|nr:hypothetical protein [Pseudonocardia sp.]
MGHIEAARPGADGVVERHLEGHPELPHPLLDERSGVVVEDDGRARGGIIASRASMP